MTMKRIIITVADYLRTPLQKLIITILMYFFLYLVARYPLKALLVLPNNAIK